MNGVNVVEVVLCLVAVVLSLVGLTTIIKGISFAVFKSNRKQSFYHLIRLDENDADIALQDAAAQLNYQGVINRKAVIAVDMGMTQPMRKICKSICNDMNIPLCKQEELITILKEK